MSPFSPQIFTFFEPALVAGFFIQSLKLIFSIKLKSVERITRTPDHIRKKIEGWLIRHEHKDEDQFDGKEVFTLFSKLSSDTSSQLKRILELTTFELPALLLFVGNNGYIVNTTERFIRISGSNIESVPYSDFHHHLGFTSISAKDGFNAKSGSIKQEGNFQEFGIKIKSGQIVYWTLPSGKPGFAFWNVTNKCEIIGRRFLIRS